MSKVLVTGGAGFIGSHVVRELRKQNHTVIVVDDLSGGFKENLSLEDPFIIFYDASVTSDYLDIIFQAHKPEYCWHLSAYAAEGLSHFIRRFNYTNNVVGSMNVINACIKHKVKCLVFTSSIAVYGHPRGFEILPPGDVNFETATNLAPEYSDFPIVPRAFYENDIPNPTDPYGIAKYAVEMDLKAAREQFGLNYVIFRPHNVYGEYQNIGDKYRNVIGIFMNQIMQGKPLTIFGDGTQTRQFSYVGDIIPAIVASAFREDCYGEIFNIGGDNTYTVNEIAYEVCNAMDFIKYGNWKVDAIAYLAARKEVEHAACSHEKVRKFFGNASTRKLASGLDAMATWAKEVGARKSKDFAEIEITEGLPEGW